VREPNDPDDFEERDPNAEDLPDTDPDAPEDSEEGGGDSGVPRLIVLDAEAVIQGSETLFVQWQQTPCGAVLSLVNVLSWAMAHQGAEFVLVVQESARVGDHEIEAAHLRQHVPAPGETVSQALIAVAEEAVAQGRKVTVVSSDVDVIRFAVEEHVQASLADLFAAGLIGGTAAGEDDRFEKPKGLTAKESAEWDAFVVKWRGRQRTP
jgi:hypothetical protein